MFKKLSTRLTVLYAAMFGAVLLSVSLAVFLAITGTAQRQIRMELAATGTVFDRVWSMRSERLREGAGLLSRDFGFREAAATADAATIGSALDNLRQRMGIDLAFMVDTEGRVFGAELSDADRVALVSAFNDSDDPSGVFLVGRQPYQLVTAPVLTPELIGWVGFAVRLDNREMRALEELAAIPLSAVVMHRSRNGAWSDASGSPELSRSRVQRFIEDSIKAKASPVSLDLSSGQVVALVKPLRTMEPGGGATVLLLRYPLASALAPFRSLLIVVGILGLTGLVVVSWGSWLLARGVTRPISELEGAAQRLQRGEDARVEIDSNDEIGRLARSFNAMAGEIRDRERKITHQALHDDDTGLPNRLAFERMVEALANGPSGQIFVVALGIDRFNHIRGAIGYKLAAQAVRMAGNRLGGLAPTCGVARISTEVLGFALIARDESAVLEAIQELLTHLEQPVQVGGEAIDLVLSVGLAALEDGAVGAAIEHSVIGLDQARAARRKVGMFDPVAYGDPAENLSMMSSLLTAIQQGQLELWHQPKLDIRQRKTTATEALVRWNHPVRGMIGPDVFIPMAEETGHIRALTEWVVRQAVADQRALADAGHRIDIAVNISGRTLGEPDFVDFVAGALKTAVGAICFEVTETAVIENPDVALEMLDRFAGLGILIAIDDFGAGLSSLAYLKRIRGHELKIDRSIIQDVVSSQRDALIVRSTIDLAHSLGLKVVAEGIETHDQFSQIAAMGCDQAQGYLLAKPMPLSALFEFLEEDQPALSARG